VILTIRSGPVLVRYADDVVIIFGNEQDARRVFDVLPKRFAKYGLTLHPEKTRLVDFRRPDRRALPSPYNGDARSRPGTFDLLGFTHYWAKSRKGHWVVKQKTAAARLRRGLKRIADWCRLHRHEPVRDQWKALKRKLLGHYGLLDRLCADGGTRPRTPSPQSEPPRRTARLTVRGCRRPSQNMLVQCPSMSDHTPSPIESSPHLSPAVPPKAVNETDRNPT